MLDMTAAAIAPKPSPATIPGVKYASVCGKIIAGLSGALAPNRLQSALFPAAPMITHGMAAMMQITPAIIDCHMAAFSDFAESTR